MNQHVTISIEGQVQGVGFRWSVDAQARRAGLTGFVRTEDDGSVTIEAEGPGPAVDRFVAWCRHGPPTARVERVTVTPGPLQGFSLFEIRF